MNENQAVESEKPAAAGNLDAVVKPQGNRAQRRMQRAIMRRMAARPGRGYTKRSAAQDQIPQRKSEHLKLIKAMQENVQVQDRITSGDFDKYLDRDYGPELAKKYGARK